MTVSNQTIKHILEVFGRWNEQDSPGDPGNADLSRRQADRFIQLSASINRDRNAHQAAVARQKPQLRLVKNG
ncbi:hypothetical protein WKW50_16180 [Ochrobactrum sp. GPK 3]